MVFGEVLTGIALVKKSVDFIKDNISTCRDISEIAQQIDDLFEGKNQLDKKRSKKSKLSIADQFGVKTVANEIIDAKLAAEKLYEVSVLVDQRFGHGTWQSILTERAKRIEEAKKAQKERIQVKRRQQEELKELATYFVIGLILIFIIVGGAVIYSIFFRDDPLNLMKLVKEISY